MGLILKYLQTFLLSGSLVTGMSFLGNNYNPALGGILSSIPLSIPSMLLIKSISRQKDFIYSANIMVFLLSLVTCVCWYLYNIRGWKDYQAVISSLLIWLIGAILYYFLLIK